MIKQAICIGVLSIMSLTASQVYASPLGNEMKVMSKQLKAFDKAKNTNDALSALNTFKQAITQSKDLLPRKLKDLPQDSEQVQNYRAALEQLNSEVEQAIQLLETGQLVQAKQHIEQIKQIAKQGHRQFRY